MAEPGWIKHSLSVGAFEFRRSVRTIFRDTVRLAAMCVGVLFTSLILAALLVGFSEMTRSIETIITREQIRGSVCLFWLFAVFLIGSRVVSARPHIDAEPLLLTTVSARTVAMGLLVAETLRVLSLFGLPILVLTGALVTGFDTLWSYLLVPTGLVLFVVTAVLTGAVFGYAAVWLATTSRFVARHKTVLGYIGSFVVTGAFYLFFFPQIGGVSQASLAWIPIGWLYDLIVVGTPLMESLLYPAGVLLSSAVLLIVGGALIEVEVTALWFTAPVSVDTGERPRTDDAVERENFLGIIREDALAAAAKPLVVPRIVSMPTRRVAEWSLLRTRRDPRRLMFLLIPLFIIGSSLVSTGLQSEVPYAVAVPLCTVFLPWLVGSIFALNPLGDEGTMLPVTLTAVSGTQYVRGLMMPGLLLGLPVVILVTGIAGVVSPYALIGRTSLVILSVYLTCVSVAIAPAIGMAFPRFSAISVGQSRKVLPPRMSAVVLHMALILVPGSLLTMLVIAPGVARLVLAGLFGSLPAFVVELLTDSGVPLSVVATGFSHVGGWIQALEIWQLQAVAWGLLVGGGLLTVLLYRNAIHRFERYTLS